MIVLHLTLDRVKSHMYTWDMTHLYVRHDSFICETWLIYMWDMTHLYMRHDSFICEIWLIHMQPTFKQTHSRLRMTESRLTRCHVPHVPLKEEIRPSIFGSWDLSIFPIDLLSDGDSVYSTEKSFGILGPPVKICLMCMGIPVKTCGIFWQS